MKIVIFFVLAWLVKKLFSLRWTSHFNVTSGIETKSNPTKLAYLLGGSILACVLTLCFGCSSPTSTPVVIIDEHIAHHLRPDRENGLRVMIAGDTTLALVPGEVAKKLINLTENTPVSVIPYTGEQIFGWPQLSHRLITYEITGLK
jgi:hypothetical protein